MRNRRNELTGRFEGSTTRGRLLLRLADGDMQTVGGGRRVSAAARVPCQAATRPIRPDDGANDFVFAPLGGVGEIGMNLSIYGFGDRRRRKWLIVDCGVSFASEEHLPGVDLILPDIRYLIEERKNIVGLVLTHAHEDHIGAMIDLWPRLKVPVYATPFTAALFEAKRAGRARRAGNPGQCRAGLAAV